MGTCILSIRSGSGPSEQPWTRGIAGRPTIIMGQAVGRRERAAEEQAHTAAWRRNRLALSLGPLQGHDRDDMGHGAHVHLDQQEHSR